MQPVPGWQKPDRFLFRLLLSLRLFRQRRKSTSWRRSTSARVTWRPILLGAVFKITGGQPLPTIPLKGSYAAHDLARSARLFNVPFKMPSKFPVSGTAPSRAFYWLGDRDPALAKRSRSRSTAPISCEDRDISNPEVTGNVAAKLGVDKAELSKRSTMPR